MSHLLQITAIALVVLIVLGIVAARNLKDHPACKPEDDDESHRR